jgi:hypothetical protein
MGLAETEKFFILHDVADGFHICLMAPSGIFMAGRFPEWERVHSGR